MPGTDCRCDCGAFTPGTWTQRASWPPGEEALLAQKVLAGETRGYRSHPQLIRFRAQPDPLAAIGAFLDGIAAEAGARGYLFDSAKIRTRGAARRIPETKGQLLHEEWGHLRDKN